MIEGFRRSSTRRSVMGIAAIAACAALAAAAATTALADPPPALFAGGTHGVVFVHGAHGAGNPHKNRSQQLVYHFGSVMTTGASVKSIFWGSSWNNTTFAGDKISGIDSFYRGVGGTSYAGTNIEYTQSGGQTVSGAVSYSNSVVDSSATPSGPPSTTAVLAVVARNVSNPTPNGYYPVYSERGRGNAGYCAWHSWGSIGGVVVQFAFFFNLDGDAGCSAGTSGGHSPGLTALGNVSGHELSEALTDPHGDAWYDQSGNENADKCAWTFGSPVQFSNSTVWNIQGNWSNAAYTNGGSYLGPGSGCIDGN